jgi:acyl-CoA reductase-like NAD-dependent aldehyde dehydrogenase
MAPDYVICHRSKYAEFTAKLSQAVESFFGPDASASGDYCRMCTVTHAERAVKLMETAVAKDGAKVICGGASSSDAKSRYV